MKYRYFKSANHNIVYRVVDPRKTFELFVNDKRYERAMAREHVFTWYESIDTWCEFVGERKAKGEEPIELTEEEAFLEIL